MHVHGIRLERRPGARDRERLDLVEQNDRRAAARRDVRQRALEEARHAALALAEELAREGVRIDLHEDRATELARDLVGEPAGERRLAGARWPREDHGA